MCLLSQDPEDLLSRAEAYSRDKLARMEEKRTSKLDAELRECTFKPEIRRTARKPQVS